MNSEEMLWLDLDVTDASMKLAAEPPQSKKGGTQGGGIGLAVE